MTNRDTATVRDLPVLLISFRRPDETREVLDAVRKVRPRRIFVASDGPRREVKGEAESVRETRQVLDRGIDWDCTVERRYSSTNLGCRRGVSSAITWFFNQVEEGVILEDDCVPHPDFFDYCADLLARYRHDERVMCISGDNSVRLRFTGDASYGFIRHAPIWGWATWRRAWTNYEDNLDSWPSLRGDADRLTQIWPDRIERAWQVRLLDRLREFDEPDSWAYRWSYSIAVKNGVAAVPQVNLISNVGFGIDATHTRSLGHPRDSVPTAAILPLRHPLTVERDLLAERRFFDKVHGGRTLRSLLRRAARTLISRSSLLRRLATSLRTRSKQ
jgi:hypothetical protein